MDKKQMNALGNTTLAMMINVTLNDNNSKRYDSNEYT